MPAAIEFPLTSFNPPAGTTTVLPWSPCVPKEYNEPLVPLKKSLAPSYFQQMMASIVLLGLIYSICEVYLDDIIIYADGHIQFCERLEILFQRLEDKNISLKADTI